MLEFFLNHELVLNFIECFSYIHWDDHIIFSHHSIPIVNYIALLEETQLDHSFIRCRIFFPDILFRSFTLMFTSRICLWFWFLAVSLWSLGINVILASKNTFGSVSHFSILLKNRCDIGVISFLGIWKNLKD